MTYLLSLLSILCSLNLLSAETAAPRLEKNIQRLVVFPVQSTELANGLKSSLWWSFRKKISEDGRFLVASKDFLESKDVYQERSELRVSDVVLLSRHLDSDALITIEFTNNQLHLRTYSGDDGSLLIEIKEELKGALSPENALPQWIQSFYHQWIAHYPAQAKFVSFQKSRQELSVQLSSLIKEPPEKLYLSAYRRIGLGELWRNNYKAVENIEMAYVEKRDSHYVYQLQGLLSPNLEQDNLFIQSPDIANEWSKKWLGQSKNISTDSLVAESMPKKEKNTTSNTWFKVFAGLTLCILLGVSL